MTKQTERAFKNLGVRMPAQDLDKFIACFDHGGASDQIRSWIYTFLENPPPPPTKPVPLSEADVRRIVREEIANATSPWVDS